MGILPQIKNRTGAEPKHIGYTPVVTKGWKSDVEKAV